MGRRMGMAPLYRCAWVAVLEMWPATVHFGGAPAERAYRLPMSPLLPGYCIFGDLCDAEPKKSLEMPMPIAAATHTSDVFWFLPLFGLLLIVVVMFCWNRRSKATTNRRLDQVERELATVRNQILLVTTSAVPDGRTVQTLG